MITKFCTPPSGGGISSLIYDMFGVCRPYHWYFLHF